MLLLLLSHLWLHLPATFKSYQTHLFRTAFSIWLFALCYLSCYVVHFTVIILIVFYFLSFYVHLHFDLIVV